MKSNNSLTLDLLSEADDATLVDKNSEAYRHECEVLSVVRMYREKGGDHVKKYLLQVEKHRGSETTARLREEALSRLRLAEVGRKS
jgi:hypothetical protein